MKLRTPEIYNIEDVDTILAYNGVDSDGKPIVSLQDKNYLEETRSSSLEEDGVYKFFPDYNPSERAKVTGRERGRLYTTGGFQSLSRSVRGYLCKDRYWDIDIVNCYPTILANLCNSLDIRCRKLEHYVDNRDDIIDELVRSKTHPNRDIVKQKFIQCIFADMLSFEYFNDSYMYEFYMNMQEIKRDLRNHPCMKEVGFMYDDEMRSTGKTAKNPLGSFLSMVLEMYEHDFVWFAIRYLESDGYNVACVIHDGFLVEKQNVPIDTDKLNKAIFEKYNFDVKFIVKDFKLTLSKNDMLSNAEKFLGAEKVLDINVPKLNFPDLRQTLIENKMLAIVSGTGTGKTHLVNELIVDAKGRNNKTKFLYLTLRKSMGNTFISFTKKFKGMKKFSIVSYETTKKKKGQQYKDAVTKFDNADIKTLQIESIGLLDNKELCNYSVIIDEASPFMMHMCTSDTVKANRIDIMYKFMRLIKECKSVILLDADLDRLTYLTIRELFSNRGLIIHNRYIPPRKAVVTVKNSISHLVASIDLAIQNGELPMIACDTAKNATCIKTIIQNKFPEKETLLYTQKYGKDIKLGAGNEWIGKIVIFSPTITQGVDDSETERSVFGSYTNSSIIPIDFCQMIERARIKSSIYVHLSKVGSSNYVSKADISKLYTTITSTIKNMLRDMEDTYIQYDSPTDVEIDFINKTIIAYDEKCKRQKEINPIHKILHILSKKYKIVQERPEEKIKKINISKDIVALYEADNIETLRDIIHSNEKIPPLLFRLMEFVNKIGDTLDCDIKTCMKNKCDVYKYIISNYKNKWIENMFYYKLYNRDWTRTAEKLFIMQATMGIEVCVSSEIKMIFLKYLEHTYDIDIYTDVTPEWFISKANIVYPPIHDSVFKIASVNFGMKACLKSVTKKHTYLDAYKLIRTIWSDLLGRDLFRYKQLQVKDLYRIRISLLKDDEYQFLQDISDGHDCNHRYF